MTVVQSIAVDVMYFRHFGKSLAKSGLGNNLVLQLIFAVVEHLQVPILPAVAGPWRCSIFKHRIAMTQ